MNQKEYTACAAGKLVSTTHGAWAFVPSPMPRELSLDADTVRQLSEADHALGHLNGTTGRLVNPFLVSSPLLHREAILSSSIEGTFTTPEELVLFETGDTETIGPSDRAHTQEVFNYIRALRFGLERLKTLPVCLRLIREIHAKLMDGARGKDKQPGEFRTSQNFIGSESFVGTAQERIAHACYVPPPVPEMNKALDDFEQAIQETLQNPRKSLPLLVRLALVHYQFEAIHPFVDGNGRIGRLLMPLVLCSQRRLDEPLLYLSAFFERNRTSYYDLMLAVSQRGDWSSWLRFFLRGVEECAKEAREQAEALIGLRESYRQKLQSARSSSLLLKLIDELFKTPSITIGRTAKVLDITNASASANLHKLVEAGILVERTGRVRNQRFAAPGILEFFEKNLPEPAAPTQTTLKLTI